MTFLGMRVFALIPARGGSIGIPRKNLQLIGGQSLVCHAIGVAKRLEWVDRIVLSTDDVEIAREGSKCGLEVTFQRPDHLATSVSKSVDVWKHAWVESEALDGVSYDASVLLEPSSPLRIPSDIEGCLGELLASDAEAAATISETPPRWNAYKAVKRRVNGRLVSVVSPDDSGSIRQLLPVHYHRNGLCYAVRRNTVMKHGRIYEQDCLGLITTRPVVNIDTYDDLLEARLLYRGDTG